MILLITFCSFAPSLNNGFTNWDDEIHIQDNPEIRSLSPQNILRIFQSTSTNGYIPLTMLSFAIEYHFFKLNPFVYHLNNLLLHLGVVYLIFILSRHMGLSLRASFVATMLFAIHPMHVESVVWVSERKDVLYAFFYMLSLVTYGRYVQNKNIRDYGLTLVFGFLSVLAKPMALSLPLVFFVYDFFQGRKFDLKVFCEKIPHFFYMVPIVWVTYNLQVRVPQGNPIEGALIWIWTFVFYIQKFLFPTTMVPYYQLPEPVGFFQPVYGLAVFLFSLIGGIVWVWRKNRWVKFAMMFYVASIFFLLRFDGHDINVVADRYMYLPSLGLCVLIGVLADFGLSIVSSRKKFLFYGAYLSCGFLVATLALKTFLLTGIWKDSLSLWNYVIQNTSDVAFAYSNRGRAYDDLGQEDLALRDYQKALGIDSTYARAYNHRGAVYYRRGQYAAALEEFHKAIQHNPVFVDAYCNRGNVYRKEGRFDLALADYSKAIALNPNCAQAYNNRAVAFESKDQDQLALKDYQQALILNPYYIEAYYNKGNLYRKNKEYPLAVENYSKALGLSPEHIESYNNRGICYKNLKEYDLALNDYKKALQINPRYAKTFNNIGVVYLKLKQYDQALKAFTQAVTIDPDFAFGYFNRALAYEKNAQPLKASEDIKRAQSLGLSVHK